MAKKRKDPMIAASQLPSTDLKAERVKTELPEPRDMKAYLGVSAQIAQDTIYCRNWKIPNALEHFPTDPLMRTVTKYFMHAVGGPLYVDEPIGALEVKQCEEKAKVMKKMNLRYVYIEQEADLEDVLPQLEDEVTRGVA